eukprot:s1894_g5.t1
MPDSGNGPAIMLIGVIGVVCVAVAALGRKVKKEREMVTLQAERAAEREARRRQEETRGKGGGRRGGRR